MRELTIPIETADDAEFSAAMTIVMDKNGRFYLHAPVDNAPLALMLHGMQNLLLQEGFRKARTDSKIIKASEQVLRDLQKDNGTR